MRRSLWAVSLVALGFAPAVYAQSTPDGLIAPTTPTVNQRLNAPTNQADTYMGVSLGQLIVALGLSLKGVSYGPADIRMVGPRQTAEVPLEARGSGPQRPVAIRAAPEHVPSP